MERPLKTGSSAARGRITPATVGLVAVCLCLLSGCTTAFVAIGVAVVGVGAAALAFECDEPISVEVWDPTSSHPVCDAEVTATNGSSRVVLPPCYTTTLGEGTWTVTAAKAGIAPATGVVTVAHDHRCAEPLRHSLELTLGGGATPPFRPMPTPGVPGSPPMPAPTAPMPAPAPSAPSSAVPPAGPGPGSAPTISPSAPATAAPKASFPPAQP